MKTIPMVITFEHLKFDSQRRDILCTYSFDELDLNMQLLQL